MVPIFTRIQFSKITFFVLSAILGVFLSSVSLIAISAWLGLVLIFERYLQIKIPAVMSFMFVIFIILTLVLWSYFNFYEKYLWWDDLLHAIYGGAFAFLWYLLIQYLSDKRWVSNDVLLICLFSFCFSMAFWALWEIYEYSYDTFMDGNMQRTDQGNWVTDTMNDIIIESLAALVTNIYIYSYLKIWKMNWVGKLTRSFKRANVVEHY